MENFTLKNSIINQALEIGFDFAELSDDTTIEEIRQQLLDFFNENREQLPRIEDECEVSTHGHSQSVSYGDFQSDGEIVCFSDHWNKAPGTKVFHSDFVMEQNGIMHNMNLYYLVGETDYNTSK